MWLQCHQDIRKALEAFWDRPRELSKEMLELSGFSTEEVLAVSEIISANLTPGYISTVQAEEQQVLAGIVNARVRTAVPLQKEWGSSIMAWPSAPLSKTKSKTCPCCGPEVTEEIENRGDLIADSTQENTTIRAKKRAFSVLTLMFPEITEEAAKSIV
jgi:hypothetical protein